MIIKALTYSSLAVTALLVILIFVTSTNYTQLSIATSLYGILIFLAYVLYSQRHSRRHRHTSNKEVGVVEHDVKAVHSTHKNISKEEQDVPSVKFPVLDMERRAFLKFIGATGISFFIFSLLGRRFEEVIFQGSKNQANNSQSNSANTPTMPTDKYRISDIDDQLEVTYYGFTSLEGEWFIMKEDSEGSFRYSKGDSRFSSNWSNRENLDYDYYYRVFN